MNILGYINIYKGLLNSLLLNIGPSSKLDYFAQGQGWEFPQPLWVLSQCCTSHIRDFFFFISDWNVPHCSLCPLLLVFHCVPLRIVWLHLLCSFAFASNCWFIAQPSGEVAWGLGKSGVSIYFPYWLCRKRVFSSFVRRVGENQFLLLMIFSH